MSSINEILASPQLSLLWICAIAAALVFMALVYSTATFRHTETTGASVKTMREVVWTVLPILIVIAAAAPAMRAALPRTLDQGLAMESSDDSCAKSKPASNDVKLVAASICKPTYR